MKKLSLDRLVSVNAEQAGKAAFSCVSSIQHLTPEQQIAGLAVAFQLLARKFDAHMGTVLTVANNLVDAALHRVPALGATEEYLKHEL